MISKVNSSRLSLARAQFLSIAFLGLLATQGCASRKFNQKQNSEGSSFVSQDKQGNTLALVPVQHARSSGEHGVCWYLAVAPAATTSSDPQASASDYDHLKQFLGEAIAKKSFVRLPLQSTDSGLIMKEVSPDVSDVTSEELFSTRETRLDSELERLLKDRKKIVLLNEHWKKIHATLSNKRAELRDAKRRLVFAGNEAQEKVESIDVDIAEIKKVQSRTAGQDLAKEGQTHSMDETKTIQSNDLVYLNAYLSDHMSAKSSAKGAPCPAQPEFETQAQSGSTGQ